MYNQIIEFIHSEIEAFVIVASAIAVLCSLGSFILRKNKTSALPTDLPEPLFQKEKEQQIEPCKHRHADDLSKRFQRALASLKEKHKNLEISEVAKLCGYSDTFVIENIINGTSPTAFTDIDNVARHFGINPDWLAHGYGTIFNFPNLSVYEPTELLGILRERKPEKLIFVRSDSKYGEVCFVLKIDEFRYETYSSTTHLSKEVGGTGQRHLYKLYKLIKTIKDERVVSNCTGRTLPDKEFLKLLHGKVYPGAVVDNYHGQDYWWDDLTDIDGEYLSAKEDYIEHGQQFVDAQNIIRSGRKYYEERNAALNTGKNY